MVTACPASTPDVLPESVNAAPFSAALITSSLVMLFMLTATVLRSTVSGWVMLVCVPALFAPLTVMFSVPAGQLLTSAAGTPTLQLPFASTVAA